MQANFCCENFYGHDSSSNEVGDVLTLFLLCFNQFRESYPSMGAAVYEKLMFQ